MGLLKTGTIFYCEGIENCLPILCLESNTLSRRSNVFYNPLEIVFMTQVVPALHPNKATDKSFLKAGLLIEAFRGDLTKRSVIYEDPFYRS